jgi:hypothetical protein
MTGSPTPGVGCASAVKRVAMQSGLCSKEHLSFRKAAVRLSGGSAPSAPVRHDRSRAIPVAHSAGIRDPADLLQFSGGSAIFRSAVHRAMGCGGATNSAEMVTPLGESR